MIRKLTDLLEIIRRRERSVGENWRRSMELKHKRRECEVIGEKKKKKKKKGYL